MKKLLIFTTILLLAASAFAVTFTVTLTDDYGDGWNGGLLDVTVAGVLVLDDLTIVTGTGPESHTFDVSDGDLVELDYLVGGWGYENAYYVYDDFGVLVASSGDGGVEPDAHVEFTAVVGGGIPNDVCADAWALGVVTDFAFDTTTATPSGFGTFMSGNDLFYVFTAPGDGLMYIGLCDSGYDTKVALYGECDDTTLIASNDDSCGLQSELIDVAVVGGEDYFIQVGGYGTSAGAGLLDIGFMVANDVCADAIAVGEVIGLPFDTTGATTSGFDTHSINQDLWYVYTPSADGTAYIDLCSTSWDTKIAVYGECDVTTELDYNDDSCSAQSEIIDLAVVGGEDYYIQVGGYGSYFGPGLLDIELTTSNFGDPPINLDVTDAGLATWEASGGGATSEWLIYDTDVLGFSGIGAEAVDYNLVWASKWVPADLTAYSPGYVTKVLVNQYTDPTGVDYVTEVRVMSGDGLTVLYTQDVTGMLTIGWNEIVLDSAVPFNNTEDLWIGMYVERPGGTANEPTSPAATVLTERYDYFSYNGEPWTSINLEYGIGTEAWMLRGYVSTSPTGRSIALGEVDIERKTKKGFYTEYTGSTPTGNSMIEPNANYVHIPYNETASRAFLGYNVYLDGAFAAFTTDLFYQYTGLVDGTTYLSEVTALYDEGESIPVDYTFTFGTVVALPLPYGATFDTELPADWTNVVNAGTGVWEWYGAGTHVPVNSDGNYVGADADINPGQEWDVSLFTPSIDMSGQTLVTVEFDKNFQDFAGNGEGHAWIYSGGVYQEEIGYWDVDDPTGGEHILYQLNPSAYPDPANVQVEFWYAATSSTGWYFSLDNVDIYGDAAAAPAVFFSEYIEGSSNNKAMEIYNGSGADINLDDFRINQSVNGGGWAFQHIFPAGATLADGDVWVILNDATDPGLFDPAGADEILGYPSVVHHNGDDARGLEYSDDGGATWTLIDIIGDPDVDPGDGWDVAGVTTATQNHTLVRKDVILTGNVDWALSAGTTAGDSEWEVYDIDTFDYLGAHPGMPGGAVIVVTPMSINETLQPDDVVVVPVTIENTGTTDLTFDITVVETTTDAIIPTTRHSAPNTDLSFNERDPNMVEMNHTNNSDVLFDLQFSYPAGVGGGEAGFETDGNFLYTTKWNGDVFYRYALDGTYIEEFTVAGAAGVRDLAYDGQYFYGAAASTALFEMDFTQGAEVLVSTIAAPVACRAIAYDDGADGFWANNWSDQITLFDRSGATLDSFACGVNTSFYGFAYDDYTAGGPYLWGFCQVPQNTLVQFDIATGMETGLTFDVGALVGSTTGSSGGMFIAEGLVPGFVTIGCNIQNEFLVGLELCPGDEPWISADPLVGTVPAGTSVVVDVTLDATDLSDITKTANLVIVNNAGADVVVDVTMVVEGGGGVFDPPTNVAVDPQTGTVSWFPPVTAVIDDNFDSYAVGDYIAEVGADWTTWSGAPGGAEDALVTDAQSSSPDNSIVVELNQDLVLIMEDYTEGQVVVDLKMYVPTGFCGYYNLQQTTTPGEYWGFQIYFHTDGTASGDCGDEGILTFDFDHDTWMDCRVVVDMDNDLASYYQDGEWMIDWQWSLGTFGNVQVNQLGGVNIFGGAHSTMPTDVPMFYVDDVVVSEVSEDVTGFNVYLDGAFVETVGDDVTEYTYAGLVDGQTYDAGVSALYGGDESVIVEETFTYTPVLNFLPPNNPAAVVEDYNDVLVTWELPGGATEELGYHTGYDANGIGTGAAADFICAARFTADELAAYYGGWELTGVNVLLHSLDFSYVAIQVYEGGSYGDPGTLVYDEEITGSVLMGEFTNHLLGTPVPLVSGNEYWIGYDIMATGDHPAAVDAGPMFPDKGAWMYFSAAWQTLPELGATLDFNWIINGVVSQNDGIASVGGKRSEVIGRTHTLRNSSQFEAEVAFDSRREAPVAPISNSRALAGYTVYRDGAEIADIADPAILQYLDESLDAGTYEYTLEAYYTAPDGISVLTDPVSATVVLSAPNNPQAVSQGPAPIVTVTWEAPTATRGVASYNVYRDGVLHEEGITGLMFLDTPVATGTYIYNVTAVYDGDWESELSVDAEVDHVDANGILKPTVTALTGNYPNPFNPTTTISFSLAEAGKVSINIYNMRGQLVKTLVNTELENAYHEIVWNGKDNSGKNTASGVYFYKMKASNYTATKKMILMK